MDAIDIEILEILKENSRSTVSEISHNINLSISAVSDRLKKLEATGIIKKYTIILDEEQLDRTMTAIIMVALENQAGTDEFKKFVEEEKEILDCYLLAGDYDFALKIVTKDTHSLEQLLAKIKSRDGLRKTKTSIVLNTLKNEYTVTPW